LELLGALPVMVRRT